MVEDAKWEKGTARSKKERMLKEELVKSFKRNCKEQNYSSWYKHLKEEIEKAGVGDVKGFGYKTFKNWMTGDRESTKQPSTGAMMGIRQYLKSTAE